MNSRAAKEMYQRIVDAKIGDLISTRHEGNKKEYGDTLADMLIQQGYKEDADFEFYFEWSTCQRYIEKLAEIKPYVEPEHDIKVGDIFVYTWGYEQTNVDFYQVIKVTKKTVTILPIKTKGIYNYGTMTGNKTPIKNSFTENDKPIRKKPYLFMDEWHLKFDHGVASPWNGEPVSYSSYH
ncbi:MAG: hypothetical protein WC292_00210 [Clostridia bacterium]